jgi:hypothetical protein
VPDSDCRRVLSIIGARKTRNVFQRGLGLDTGKFLIRTAGWNAAAPGRL